MRSGADFVVPAGRDRAVRRAFVDPGGAARDGSVDMRILHVAEATFAGVGRHVVDLTKAQSEAGHEVVVLYGTRRESERFRLARDRNHLVHWRPIDVARGPDRADFKAVQTIRALARGFRPDVIHGHSAKGGILAHSAPKGPWTIVYTPHAVYSMNPELGRRARSGVDLVERGLSTRTDLVVAVSPEEETHLRMMGIEQNKITMIPNGIPPLARADGDLVRRALGLPLDRPVVGFVGRVDDQKAPHTLLDIFKHIAVARADVDFVVVGDGTLLEAVRERAGISPSLAGRIHLVGEQPGPWAMSGMDVLLLPSRYEGMPYVLIEAAHLGLPMVVTRAAGSSLLQDGPATIHVADVGDVRTMADACIELTDRWPDDLPGQPDRRFTLDGMAQLTELAYLRQPVDLREGADRPDPAPVESPASLAGPEPVVFDPAGDDELDMPTGPIPALPPSVHHRISF